MPRLSASVIAKREQITTRNFIAGMTMEQANAELVKLDGMKMNPYRLKEIFDEVQKTSKVDNEIAAEIMDWKPSYETPVPDDRANREDEIDCEHDEAIRIAKMSGEPIKAFDKPTSIFDLPPAKIESNEGYMTIRELIKALEAGQFTAR